MAEFKKSKVHIFGVNPASAKSHASWAGDLGLPFPLLSDEGSRTAKAFGAKGFLVLKRTVIGIDGKGIVRYYERGMPSNDAILEAMKTSS